MSKTTTLKGAKISDDMLAYIKELQDNDNEIITALQKAITCSTDLIIKLADLKGPIERETQNALANLVSLKEELGVFSTEGGAPC